MIIGVNPVAPCLICISILVGRMDVMEHLVEHWNKPAMNSFVFIWFYAHIRNPRNVKQLKLFIICLYSKGRTGEPANGFPLLLMQKNLSYCTMYVGFQEVNEVCEAHVNLSLSSNFALTTPGVSFKFIHVLSTCIRRPNKYSYSCCTSVVRLCTFLLRSIESVKRYAFQHVGHDM